MSPSSPSLCFSLLYSLHLWREVRLVGHPGLRGAQLAPKGNSRVQCFSCVVCPESDSGVTAAVRGPGRTSRGPSGRGGVFVAGLGRLILVEAHADVTLEGSRCQPLLGQAALEEGDTGAEVGQTVHPAGDLMAAQQLGNTHVYKHTHKAFIIPVIGINIAEVPTVRILIIALTLYCKRLCESMQHVIIKDYRYVKVCNM